jgi:FkbM family methyltransferase
MGNLQLNQCVNVRAINVACAEPHRGAYGDPSGNRGLTGTIRMEGPRLEGSVRAEPLDQLLTPEEKSKTRLIKIDVEGPNSLFFRICWEVSHNSEKR